jgi:hypothetical protein
MISVAGTGPTSMLVKWNTIAATAWQVWRSTLTNPNADPATTPESGWSTFAVLPAATLLPAGTVEFSDTTVVAGNVYRYKVSYQANSVWSAYSDPPQWAASWPVTPASVVVTGTDATHAVLSWGDVNAETGFVAQQKLRTAATCAAETDWVTNTTVLNTGVNGLSTIFTTANDRSIYCYRVKAVNGVGSSGSSAWSAVVTKLRPPITINLSNIADKITVDWTDDTSENTGYRLEYATDGLTNWSTLQANLGANVTTYTHSGLTPGRRYDYRVRTMLPLDVGVSEPTAAVLFARPKTTVPATPTATATPSTITVLWDRDGSAGRTGYSLQYVPKGTTCDWTTNVVTKDLALPTYGTYTLNVGTDISAATLYCFRISAYIINNNLTPIPPAIYSDYSNSTEYATVLPAPPSFSSTAKTDKTISLTWTPVAGNFGYLIQRSTSSDFTTNLLNFNIPANAITYVDNATNSIIGGTAYPPSPATTYYYRIYTKNLLLPTPAISSMPYPSSGGLSVLTLTETPPEVTVTAVSPWQIDVTWKSVFGQKSNIISRSGASSAFDFQTQSYTTDYCGYTYPTVACPTATPSKLSFSSTGLEPNSNYCYEIIALNSADAQSARSAIKCATTPKVGPAVTAESQNGVTINVSWSYPGPNQGFEVEAQLWNGSWVQLGTVQTVNLCTESSKCSYEDKYGVIDPKFINKDGIAIYRLYNYRVRAYQGTEKSGYGYASTEAFNTLAPFKTPVCLP